MHIFIQRVVKNLRTTCLSSFMTELSSKNSSVVMKR